MPVLKIRTKAYSDDYALENVVNYVLRPGCSYGGYAVDPNYAVEQMLMVKDIWGKDQGRRVRHFILSFGRNERIHTAGFSNMSVLRQVSDCICSA